MEILPEPIDRFKPAIVLRELFTSSGGGTGGGDDSTGGGGQMGGPSSKCGGGGDGGTGKSGSGVGSIAIRTFPTAASKS